MKSTERHAPTLEILTRTLKATGRLGNRLARILESDDHRQLLSVQINPKGYSDWREFFSDYASLALVKKYPFLKLKGINPRAKAMETYWKSEAACRARNNVLGHESLIPSDLWQYIVRAKREIRRILKGSFSWDDVLPFLSHGPGATFGTRREYGHAWYKFGDKQPTVTGECLALHSIFLKYCGLWGSLHEQEHVRPKVVRGSKITTVPKDAKTDRVIAIEPLLNMFYQKGIGGLLRSRLMRSGCDLNDQSINQRLACAGSKDGSLATIDLSSASDSVSRSLVELLLPEDWVTALKCTRSDYTYVDGQWSYLQKFSSMGNGYTFELESLIFLALGRAVCQTGNVVSVYGDDIIITSDKAPVLIRLLRFLGFNTNESKSFLDGPFRESCGKHYFLGHDVTPLYVKADIQSQERYLWYLNSIRRLAHRFIGMQYGCSDRYHKLYLDVYSLVIPRYRSLSIPDGYGDGGIVRDFDEVSPKPNVEKHQVEGYRTKHLVRRFKKRIVGDFPQLLLCLFRLEKGKEKFPVLRPKEPVSARLIATHASCHSLVGDTYTEITLARHWWAISRLSVTRWSDLGPWVSEP